MCLALYIAADRQLPLIPWDEKAPVFHVRDLSAKEQVVRPHFSKPYVYYAGAHEGCGCGFNYGRQYPELEADAGELKAARESVARLSAYLSDAVAAGGAVEVLACWEGDQAKEPQRGRRLTPEEVRLDGFYFKEEQEMLIVEDTHT